MKDNPFRFSHNGKSDRRVTNYVTSMLSPAIVQREDSSSCLNDAVIRAFLIAINDETHFIPFCVTCHNFREFPNPSDLLKAATTKDIPIASRTDAHAVYKVQNNSKNRV